MNVLRSVGIRARTAQAVLIFDIGRRPSIRLPGGRVSNHKSLPRPSPRRGGFEKAATEDDASETERPSLERTQQRIELQMKTANFHCMRRDTIAALRW